MKTPTTPALSDNRVKTEQVHLLYEHAGMVIWGSMLMAVLLLVVEIAGRRLAIWERRAIRDVVVDEEIAPVGERRSWWKAMTSYVRRVKPKPRSESTTVRQPSDAPPPGSPAPSMTTMLEQAKQRARRRNGDS